MLFQPYEYYDAWAGTVWITIGPDCTHVLDALLELQMIESIDELQLQMDYDTEGAVG